MNLLLQDLVVLLLSILGMASAFNSFDIPYYIFLIVLVVYGGLRLAGISSNKVKK